MTAEKKKSPPKKTKETAKKLPEKISKIDWELIENEYRAGSLSVSEIARQNKISHQAVFKRAKEKGWRRDLTEAVRKRIKQKLVAVAVAGRNGKASDEEITEAAAERGKEVALLQRKDIARLRTLELSVIDEVQNNPTKLYLAQYQGQVVERIVSLTASEKAMAVNNLANVQHKRIALERQAYNIDPDEKRNDPVEEIIVTYVGGKE